jgi:hypothetical protein
MHSRLVSDCCRPIVLLQTYSIRIVTCNLGTVNITTAILILTHVIYNIAINTT